MFGFIPALLLLLIVGLQPFVPISVLVEDTNAVAKMPLYYGAVSNIGIVLWSAAAGICLFSGFARKSAGEGLRPFLFVSGVLTAYLMLDDLFLAHERILPKMFSLQQVHVYALYIAGAIAYFGYFRRTILSNELLFFVLAAVCFGLSVFLDSLSHLLGHDYQWFLLEEGFKLLGIVSWLLYLIHLSAKHLNRRAPLN